MEGKRNYESCKSDNLRLVGPAPMIETNAYCREKQSTVESGHGTEPESTDNDEGNQTSEDDRSETFSNDDSIETEDQNSNDDEFETHREHVQCLMIESKKMKERHLEENQSRMEVIRIVINLMIPSRKLDYMSPPLLTRGEERCMGLAI